MRIGSEHVGARGLAVLAGAGCVAIALAIHGYGRGLAAPPSLSASTPSARPPARPVASPHRPTRPRPAPKVGPLLSSTPYAPYAYRVYPGPLSERTKLAIAGFTFRVRVSGGRELLSVGAPSFGQAPRTTPLALGDRVYFIETTLGDDSNDADYSAGDDGVVVTDAAGHLLG
ncbi:MAG TPA: hypothetical protein VKV23_08005 [Acidimicrobiales bacterium]|jgi:hypothetical protein|nr:hypothetical protein [Acidimicrobiales bacterium]